MIKANPPSSPIYRLPSWTEAKMPSLHKLTTILLLVVPFVTCSPSIPHYQTQLPLSKIADKFRSHSLSALSWGANRIDVFANAASSGNVSHKWWDGYQWGPSASTVENLGGDVATAPIAISWGKERQDIFAANLKGVLYHKFFDGYAWQPSGSDFESLSIGFDPSYTVSATTWGFDRLDVFGLGPGKDVVHKYWDGHGWQPNGNRVESLGGDFMSGPTSVSWDLNRLDLFAIEGDYVGYVYHKYWDGSQWVGWEFLGGPKFFDSPTAISWGANRLDLFGIAIDGAVHHTAWDGSRWLDWESLGGDSFVGTVGAISWGPNRLDLVALSASDNTYHYKFWDGSQWKPDAEEWYPKRGDFSSSPAVSSWGNNRLDIFGVSREGELLHQTWWGEGWYPGPDEWESLGGPIKALEEEPTMNGGEL